MRGVVSLGNLYTHLLGPVLWWSVERSQRPAGRSLSQTVVLSGDLLTRSSIDRSGTSPGCTSTHTHRWAGSYAIKQKELKNLCDRKSVVENSAECAWTNYLNLYNSIRFVSEHYNTFYYNKG